MPFSLHQRTAVLGCLLAVRLPVCLPASVMSPPGPQAPLSLSSVCLLPTPPLPTALSALTFCRPPCPSNRPSQVPATAQPHPTFPLPVPYHTPALYLLPSAAIRDKSHVLLRSRSSYASHSSLSDTCCFPFAMTACELTGRAFKESTAHSALKESTALPAAWRMSRPGRGRECVRRSGKTRVLAGRAGRQKGRAEQSFDP